MARHKAGLVPRRKLDRVKGDLQDDSRLDRAVVTVIGNGDVEQQRGHLGDLVNVGEPGVRLADGGQLIGVVDQPGEGDVAEDTASLAVTPLGADHDDIERVEGTLELEPVADPRRPGVYGNSD